MNNEILNSNELKREVSPYLQQHAHNPIAWKAWSPQTLELAQKHNKPIFLSIGYATCHWCHVMEAESFSSVEFAGYMNENFICIKVDREERPDIDHLYMKACQAITGQGGWPLNCFLSPDTSPLFAGTYFPLNDQHGRPGIFRIARAIADMYAHQKEKLISDSAKILQAIARESSINADPEKIKPGLIEAALEELRNRFDASHGGFGHSPKFPTPHTLDFILRTHAHQKDDFSTYMVEKSLSGMAQFGMRDHIGGGFFRYSTDAQWRIPHFEKMLYDNALLLLTFAESGAYFQKDSYKNIAAEIVNYIESDLKLNPGYACAEDADSEGVEGLFYTWTHTEIENTLDEDLELFRQEFELGPKGEFSEPGKSNTPRIHLQRKQGFENLAQTKEFLNQLKKIRSLRNRPFRDDKILLDWNALYAAALAKSGKILQNPQWIAKAEKLLQWLWIHFKKENGHFLHRSCKGETNIPATLEDYAYLLWALLEVHQATGKNNYLTDALHIANIVESHFKDPESGAYFFSSNLDSDLLLRTIEFYDGALPSGQSVLAYCFLRLHNQTAKPWLQKSAAEIICVFGERLEQHPSSFCFLLKAYLLQYKGIPTLSTNANKLPYEIYTGKNALELEMIWADDNHPSLPSYLNALLNQPNEQWILCKNLTCSLPQASLDEILELL